MSCTSNGIILRGSTVLGTIFGPRPGPWWSSRLSRVEKKVKNCLACQANTDRQQFAPLMPSEIPPARGTPSLKDGSYWFVNYCEYSKWAHVAKVCTTNEDNIEKVLEPLLTTSESQSSTRRTMVLRFNPHSLPPFGFHTPQGDASMRCFNVLFYCNFV